MVSRLWASVALLGGVVAQDYSQVGQYTSSGCYSGIPSSFTSQGSSASNSGLDCYTKCDAAGFTVMALQDENCYCGNELPAGSADGTCDVACPGYSSDQCGGSSAYNIYIKKGASVSTAASDDSSSSSTSGASSSGSSSATSSSSSSDSSSTSTDGSSSSATSSSSDTTETSSSPTSSPSQATTTISGSVVVSTVTATQSSSQTSSSSSSSSSQSSSSSASASAGASEKKSGLSGGAIAGIVIGVIAGLAAIAALLFFLWRRRKEDYYSPNSSPRKFETSFNSGYNQDYPSIVDQRLNPQLLNHRISIASLADARDYSRQILKVANPDDKE